MQSYSTTVLTASSKHLTITPVDYPYPRNCCVCPQWPLDYLNYHKHMTFSFWESFPATAHMPPWKRVLLLLPAHPDNVCLEWRGRGIRDLVTGFPFPVRQVLVESVSLFVLAVEWIRVGQPTVAQPTSILPACDDVHQQRLQAPLHPGSAPLSNRPLPAHLHTAAVFILTTPRQTPMPAPVFLCLPPVKHAHYQPRQSIFPPWLGTVSPSLHFPG